MRDIDGFVRQVHGTDDILDFVSRQYGDVRLSKEGWAKQQKWPDGNWLDVQLVHDDEQLNADIVQTIHTAVTGNLDTIRWMDERIEEMKQGRTSVALQDVTARLEKIRAAYEQHQLNATTAKLSGGITYPLNAVDFQVFLSDENTSWTRRRPSTNWTQVEIPVNLMRPIYDATAHLQMAYARRLEVLLALDPKLGTPKGDA